MSIEEIEQGQQSLGMEDDGQLTINAGTRVTLATLYPRNTSVEHAVVIGSKRQRGDGNLLPYGESALILVRVLAGEAKPVPTYTGDEELQKVVLEQQLKPKRIVNADSAEAMDMLAGILEKHGYRLVKEAA